MEATTGLSSKATIRVSDTLNDIVGRYPQTLPLLQRYGLDTCCGGALPLDVAAQHHGLATDEVLAALQAEVEQRA